MAARTFRLHTYSQAPLIRRNARHSCDQEIRVYGPSDGMAQPADLWTCSCGLTYEHDCDESEGCSWHLVKHARRARR
jgi:hypothetical protein